MKVLFYTAKGPTHKTLLTVDEALTTPVIQKSTDSSEDTEAQMDDAIAHCRELLRNQLISTKTREEYEHMLFNLKKEGNVQYIQGNVDFIMQTIEKADEEHNRFKDYIDMAVERNLMTPAKREEWWSKFWDPSVSEMTRSAYLKQKFFKNIPDWMKTADKRDAVLSRAKAKKISSKDVPALAKLQDGKTFAALKFQDKQGLIDEVDAAIDAQEKKMPTLHREVQAALSDLAAEGILHPSKVGVWMKRLFGHFTSEKEIRSFLDGQFENHYVKNWRSAREQFDTLAKHMKKDGEPRDFTVVDADQFLRWPYKRRASYLESLKQALGSEHAPESDEKLKHAKMDIRHFLHVKDWEGAEEAIAQAKKIDPYDSELASMSHYLDTQRDDQKTDAERASEISPNPQKVVENLRTNIKLLPVPYQQLYIPAIEHGDVVLLARLMQMTGNLVYLKEHGFWDEQKGVKDSENEFHKEQTKSYIEEGHEKSLEINILDGETEEKEAIRGRCVSPQMLYMEHSSDAISAVYRKTEERKDDATYGYWTTLKANNVTYEEQRQMVKMLHYPIKQDARFLKKHNIRFTMSGPVQFQHGGA